MVTSTIESPTTRPQGQDNQFNPQFWIYDPVARHGYPRDGLRPCSCGETKATVLMRADGSCHAYCRACYAAERSKLIRKGDVTYGVLDVEAGTLTLTKGERSMVALKEQCLMKVTREKSREKNRLTS